MKAHFTRRGDFFETTGQAAIAVSATLGVAMTTRASRPGVVFAAIPAHRWSDWSAELEAAGFEVTADAAGRG